MPSANDPAVALREAAVLLRQAEAAAACFADLIETGRIAPGQMPTTALWTISAGSQRLVEASERVLRRTDPSLAESARGGVASAADRAHSRWGVDEVAASPPRGPQLTRPGARLPVVGLASEYRRREGDAHRDLIARIGGTAALAQRCHEIRTSRGITLDVLAARMETRVRFVDDLESSRVLQPSVATVAAFARACNVAVSALVEAFGLPAGAHAAPVEPLDESVAPLLPLRPAEAMGHALASLREQRGWSPEDVAHRAGFNERYYRSMEHGAAVQPMLLTVLRVGLAFGETHHQGVLATTGLVRAFAGEGELQAAA